MKTIEMWRDEFLNENPEYKGRVDIDMTIFNLVEQLREDIDGEVTDLDAVKKINNDDENKLSLFEFVQLADKLGYKIKLEK